MEPTVDFIALCKPGMTLRTRGRSEARIHRIDAAAGLIHGEIPMYGPTAWRRDGVYRDSPGGAAGPFDLLPPRTESGPSSRRAAKLGDLVDGESRAYCCD
jgi:hypothetical protein